MVDVGSLDINGSNRGLFRKCDYRGIDIVRGKNVDEVGLAHLLLCNLDNYFDTVISTEMLEHDKYWELSLHAMYRALKPGGLLLITAAGDGREEHGTHDHHAYCSPGTLDYYCNISNEMFASVLCPKMFKTYFINQNPKSFDINFYGIKSG